jgi:hypothetical protein
MKGLLAHKAQCFSDMLLVHIPKFRKWRGKSHRDALVHIPKFRNGTGKILANASTPDFFGASDIILGYALNA